MNGSREDTKGAVLIIFIICNFNKIDLVGSLEGLAKILGFLRGYGERDFMMVDGRLEEGMYLVK